MPTGDFLVFSSQTDPVSGEKSPVGERIYRQDVTTGEMKCLTPEAYCFQPQASADGRYVTFTSRDSNFGGRTNAEQIFLIDTESGEVERVSERADGQAGDRNSRWSSVSADGRYVAFESRARNLVRGDTNDVADIFVKDRHSGHLHIVSLSEEGYLSNGASSVPVISADGSTVAFISKGDLAGPRERFVGDQVFVRHLNENRTEKVSVNNEGLQSEQFANAIDISSDGRFVSFHTRGGNLSEFDQQYYTNDVFVRDLRLGRTAMVSAPGYDDNYASAISEDGRHIAYISQAEDDVNSRVLLAKNPLHQESYHADDLDDLDVDWEVGGVNLGDVWLERS